MMKIEKLEVHNLGVLAELQVEIITKKENNKKYLAGF